MSGPWGHYQASLALPSLTWGPSALTQFQPPKAISPCPSDAASPHQAWLICGLMSWPSLSPSPPPGAGAAPSSPAGAVGQAMAARPCLPSLGIPQGSQFPAGSHFSIITSILTEQLISGWERILLKSSVICLREKENTLSCYSTQPHGQLSVCLFGFFFWQVTHCMLFFSHKSKFSMPFSEQHGIFC